MLRGMTDDVVDLGREIRQVFPSFDDGDVRQRVDEAQLAP
jgi:hypothetical protein